MNEVSLKASLKFYKKTFENIVQFCKVEGKIRNGVYYEIFRENTVARGLNFTSMLIFITCEITIPEEK